MPVSNALSYEVAKALKKYGCKYLGSVTMCSHLQACGIINDRLEGCFRYQDILVHYPTVWMQCDGGE